MYQYMLFPVNITYRIYHTYIHILNECLVKLHLNNAIWATNKQSWHWGQLRLAIWCVAFKNNIEKQSSGINLTQKSLTPKWMNSKYTKCTYIYMYMYIYFSSFHIYNVRPSLRDPHHSQVWMLPSCLRAALLRNTLRIKSIKFKKHCSISNPSSEMVLFHCESGNLNHLK